MDYIEMNENETEKKIVEYNSNKNGLSPAQTNKCRKYCDSDEMKLYARSILSSCNGCWERGSC